MRAGARQASPRASPAGALVRRLFTVASLLLCLLWWTSFWACTVFLCTIFTLSAWNGATYYFDFFLHRYTASLRSRKKSSGSALPPSPDELSTAATKKAA